MALPLANVDAHARASRPGQPARLDGAGGARTGCSVPAGEPGSGRPVARFRDAGRGGVAVAHGFIATALHAAAIGWDPLERAAQALAATQNDDGGWGYNEDVPSDADSTAWALLFLARMGRHEASVAARFPASFVISGPRTGASQRIPSQGRSGASWALAGGCRSGGGVVPTPRSPRSLVARSPPPARTSRACDRLGLAVCPVTAEHNRRLELVLVDLTALHHRSGGRVRHGPRRAGRRRSGGRVGDSEPSRFSRAPPSPPRCRCRSC